MTAEIRGIGKTGGRKTDCDLLPGDIVRSTAGRDCGRLAVVLDAEDDFVILADGRRRTTENPKRKRVRHCVKVGTAEGLSLPAESNKQLRQALSRFRVLNAL